MRHTTKKNAKPRQLYLFDAPPCTLEDIFKWLRCVPRLTPDSTRAVQYVRSYDVINKIRDAKKDGSFLIPSLNRRHLPPTFATFSKAHTMKTKLALALAAAILTGCATTTTTRDTSPAFQFTDADNKPHFVTGEMIKHREDGLFQIKWHHRLLVRIDGQQAIFGYVDPHNFTGAVSGQWNNSTPVANCTSIQKSAHWYDVTCEISLDGRTVGALKF